MKPVIPYLLLMRESYGANQTPGKLFYLFNSDIRICPQWLTLEGKWSDNNGGCMPEGVYPIHRENSPKFATDLWEFYNVPGRSECKFHWGNYYKNFDGCIGIGTSFSDLNKDGERDLISSSPGGTKQEIMAFMELTKPHDYMVCIITGPHNNWQFPAAFASFAQAFS